MKKLILLSIVLFWLKAAVAHEPSSIVGVWFNEDKTSKIEIVEKEGALFGTIVYINPTEYENGKPPLDDKNPDTKLRDRSVLGLQILSGLTYDSKNKNWQNGRIYDPESGKTYDRFGWFKDGSVDKLFLKGYVVGIKWLGRSTEWTRTSLN